MTLVRDSQSEQGSASPESGQGAGIAHAARAKGVSSLALALRTLLVGLAAVALFWGMQYLRIARDLLPPQHVDTFQSPQFHVQGPWGGVDLTRYSGGHALYTRSLRSSLELDAHLPPARYVLVVQVYNFGTGGPTRIAVEGGQRKEVFTYGGQGTGKGIVKLSVSFKPRSFADRLRLTPLENGSVSVVIDHLAIYRRPPYAMGRNLTLGAILLAVVLGMQLLPAGRREAGLADAVGVALLGLLLFVGVLYVQGHPLVYPNISPDGKLYLGLARNLLSGRGFVDTIRNDGNILPSVGQPALLAACLKLGISPEAFLTWALPVSVAMLALGARLITGSSMLAGLCALLHYCVLKVMVQAEQIFWIGSVDASLHVLGCLVLLCLACWRCFSFNAGWAVATGIAALLYTLVRPMFLPLFYVALPVVLLGCLYRRWRGGVYPLLRSLSIMLAIVVGGILMTLAVSYRSYGDSRLVSGTYSGIPLYCANNKHLDPERWYDSDLPGELSPAERGEFLKPLTPTADWRIRDRRLKEAVRDYVLQQPWRAARGWWWRFRQYMGCSANPFSTYHVAVILFVAGVGARLIRAGVLALRACPQGRGMLEGQDPPTDSAQHRVCRGAGCFVRTFLVSCASFGLLLAALFFLWLGLQSLFVYVGYRYAAIGLPFLILAGIVLGAEDLMEIRKAAGGLLHRRYKA